MRFTEGQNYSIVVPQGLLQDVQHNAVNAATVGSFLVFSGSYSANNYLGDDAIVAQLAANHATATGDTLTLLSTHPKSGATDVPVATGISVLLFFSQTVQFD